MNAAERYRVAWRPGRANAWHVIDRLTGRTVERHPSPAAARYRSLILALQAARAELARREARP